LLPEEYIYGIMFYKMVINMNGYLKFYLFDVYAVSHCHVKSCHS